MVKTDKTDKLDRTDKIDSKIDRADKADKADKTDKTKNSESAGNKGKTENAGKQEFRLRVIISPAKKMNSDFDTLPAESLPVFSAETKQILNYLKSLTYEEANALWRCNDKLAELNFARVRETALPADGAEGVSALPSLTPALIAYEGIQYRYLSPKTLEEGALRWLSEHLRILSGFYGVLRPFDGIVPYRLEMQAQARVGGCRDLYAFWGNRLCQALRTDCAEHTENTREAVPEILQAKCALEASEEIKDASEPIKDASEPPLFILNLASKEYAKAVEPYLKPGDRWLSCVFAEQKDGRLIQKATLAKMARGEMTRYLAEELSEKPDGPVQVIELLSVLKCFDRLGFFWSEALSTERELVFICGSKTGDCVKN